MAVARRRAPSPDASAGTRRATSILLVVAAAILIPIVYAVLGGFKTNGQLAGQPGRADPGPVGLRQLRRRAVGRERARRSGVSCSTASSSPSSRSGSRSAARRSRRSSSPGSGSAGREAMYTLFVFGLLFPTAVAILPLYILIRQLGLSGNLLGVALPQAAFGLPLSIVILRPFFRSIPMELEDAARIDGCGSFGFFWRMLLPLSRPALATVSVLAIVTTWNAFILPLVILNSADQWTLPLGVMNFAPTYSSDTARTLAFTVVVAHPGDDLLRDRGAPHRRRPDGRVGEGLMATTGTALPRSGPAGRRARRRPARADDPRREDRPARLVLGLRGGPRGRPRRRPAGHARRRRHRPDHAGSRARPTCARSRSPQTANAIQATSSRRRDSGSRRSSTRSACTA